MSQNGMKWRDHVNRGQKYSLLTHLIQWTQPNWPRSVYWSNWRFWNNWPYCINWTEFLFRVKGCLLKLCFSYFSLLFLHQINCLFTGSGAPVPLLSRTDRNRHVPAEQQFTLPQLPTQPSCRLSRQRSSRLSLNRRPAAVPFHEGKKRHRNKTISIDNVPKSSLYKISARPGI